MLPVPPINNLPVVQPVVQAPQTVIANTPVAQPTFVNESAPVQKASKTPDYYIIKSGDTLEAIADMHGLDVREIKAWNRQQGPRVTPGQKLRLNPFAKAIKG